MSYQPIWNGRSGYGGKRMPLWKRLILIAVCAAVVLFGGLRLFVSLNSHTVLNGTPQIMVIFGCQVKQDGPSVLLQDRLDTALTYWNENPNLTIVVSGGKGDDEHQSEAQCMYDYLVKNGVDKACILMEPQSRNTWQNVNYSLALLREKGYDTETDVILVSSGFHLGRIKMLWERAAGTTETISTLSAPVSHFPSAVQMFFREPLAVVKSFLLDR